MRRARDQLLAFAAFLERVDAHNNACERALRPVVIQRENTNGYRVMWSAKGKAAVRTVVATAPERWRGHLQHRAEHHRHLAAGGRT